jgi:ribosomal protein S18 acetylase RimI-like enzyme
MIIFHNNKSSISSKLKQEFNDLILQNFHKSRIDDYEYFIHCDHNKKVISFVGLYYIDNRLSINQLCVHNDYRRMGIAKYMLNFIKKIYKNTHIILYIDKNKPNTEYLHNYYLKFGFKDVLNLPYDYENEFLMEL